LSPVGGDPAWQITNRNKVNYDSFTGIRAADSFCQSFSKSGFPSCLPGALGTQYRILESVVELAFSFASQFHLHTDALNCLGNPPSLRGCVNQFVYSHKVPGLLRKTKKSALT